MTEKEAETKHSLVQRCFTYALTTLDEMGDPVTRIHRGGIATETNHGKTRYFVLESGGFFKETTPNKYRDIETKFNRVVNQGNLEPFYLYNEHNLPNGGDPVRHGYVAPRVQFRPESKEETLLREVNALTDQIEVVRTHCFELEYRNEKDDNET